jgi:hypothetical protein
MARFKRIDGEKLTVEIYKLNIIKAKCAENNETVKDYLNRLIKRDMLSAREEFSIKYFKE